MTNLYLDYLFDYSKKVKDHLDIITYFFIFLCDNADMSNEKDIFA